MREHHHRRHDVDGSWPRTASSLRWFRDLDKGGLMHDSRNIARHSVRCGMKENFRPPRNCSKFITLQEITTIVINDALVEGHTPNVSLSYLLAMSSSSPRRRSRLQTVCPATHGVASLYRLLGAVNQPLFHRTMITKSRKTYLVCG